MAWSWVYVNCAGLQILLLLRSDGYWDKSAEGGSVQLKKRIVLSLKIRLGELENGKAHLDYRGTLPSDLSEDFYDEIFYVMCGSCRA